MSKLKPWLFLAVIFIVGGITGSALTLGLASHFTHPPGIQQLKSHWMMRLTHQLNLTSDQQAKIDPILTGAENQLLSAHREEAGRAAQIIEETNRQIEAILTPEQQAELQKMEKEMDQNRNRMFPGGNHLRSWGSHGGPGGPGMPPHGGPGPNGMMSPSPSGMSTNSAPQTQAKP